jgi:hypothetical protein
VTSAAPRGARNDAAIPLVPATNSEKTDRKSVVFLERLYCDHMRIKFSA